MSPTDEKPPVDLSVDIQLSSSTDYQQNSDVHVTLEQKVTRSAPAVLKAYMEQNKVDINDLNLPNLQLTEEEK